MLRIEPTHAKNFKSAKPKNSITSETKQAKKKPAMLITSLATLATLGIAAISIKKSIPHNYEEALKKAGVQIKDNVALVADTGKKYTGKIQCLTNSNQKQVVEFVDGKMTENLYYSLMGKELEGSFYKDNKCILQIWRGSGQNKNSTGFIYRQEGATICKPEPFIETKKGFDWARNFIKQQYK